MKYIKNLLLILAAVAGTILTLASANAYLLIEPHLGYNLHASTTISGTEFKYNGTQFGGRLGGQFLGLMGGLDYTHSSYTLKSTTLGAVTNTSTKQNDIGVFAGFNFPILLRAWAGYYFTSKATESGGDYIKGHVTELGVGWTAIPFLSINLAYRMVSYNKSYDSNTKATSAIDYTPKEIVVGVSEPITWL